MFPKPSIFAFLACAVVADAGTATHELIGKWLWQGTDAQAIQTFAPDHTYTNERFGIENYHDVQRGTWRSRGDKLTISFQDGTKTVERIVKVTPKTLILHSAVDGSLKYTRTK